MTPCENQGLENGLSYYEIVQFRYVKLNSNLAPRLRRIKQKIQINYSLLKLDGYLFCFIPLSLEAKLYGVSMVGFAR